MTHYAIDIISDTVCPWCYVGANRLSLAIATHSASHPQDTFTTTWHAYYLNPDAPRSIDKQAYYVRKFGAQRTAVMQGHLARLGREVGIEFAFGGRTGITRDSHRLIELGRRKGKEVQTRVVRELFAAYFEANEDITVVDVLVKTGVRAGLEEGEVREWMEGGEGGEEVDREVEEARKLCIGGVPNFRINGKWEVQGAEEPAAFLRVFGEIKDTMPGSKTGGENVC
ncbi:hypothetical protein LTR59_017419 [Friedmanniomyces endolithicus]|nr:hypothetical protein LTR94_008714 [Friedmanniomyces endolithicus]KAK0768796.1 hypothetical protein LTR59_017419 [Friedmanniomyces endolithicus]KAK0770973.1 hypothetical protein LTR38_017390 [Friedmanniomyces endolithicus]